MDDLGLRWRQTRFNPLRSLTPERLASALDQKDAGWLREAAIIFETIEQREPMVRSVMTKRRAAVARRDWQIVVPDPLHPNADAHKATLEYFYHNLVVTDATDLNVRCGVSGLLRQMMDAIVQKYAAHEIVWKPGAEGLTAELRRVPLYFFENRSGRLRFVGAETRSDGMPLDEDGWMITVADGLGDALSICYIYKRLGLQDLLAFSEKFSVPGVLGRTSAKKDSPEGNAMRDSVLAYASEWVGLVYGDDGTIKDPIQVVQTPGSASLPQMTICEYMDRMIATLVRGGDLSTISRHNSTGSNPQADETDALLEDDCALVSETLQTQLDRLVIRMVHGDETPAAYIVVNPPSTTDLTKDLAIDEGLKRLGVNQTAEDLAERYGREVQETSNIERPTLNAEVKTAPVGNSDPSIHDSLDAVRAALNADMQPLGDALAGALQAGDFPAMQSALRKINVGMPGLLPVTGALADELSIEMSHAFTGEGVAANAFDLSQSRDLRGRWSESGGGGGNRRVHTAVGKVGSWQALGLEHAGDMKADPASSVSDIVRARLALERGIPVKDYSGTDLHFGQPILDHWDTENKPPAEQDRRLRRLADAVRSVTAPHEVWQDPSNGQLTYLRKFGEEGGSFTVSGFVADQSGQVRSYFHDRRLTSINKRREGRLVHKQ